MALIATYIPDIDTKHSKIGQYFFLRPMQWVVKHRGMFHSFIFLILITLFFVFFIPVLALGFFLGYGLHLFADSFTIEGIKPFYPFGKKSCGKIRTGGKSETTIFMVFVVLNLVLIFKMILNMF